MSELEVLSFISLKMFYAVLCGLIVGLERKFNSAPAGFKTQILVCVGSMLFTCIPIIAGPMMVHETSDCSNHYWSWFSGGRCDNE